MTRLDRREDIAELSIHLTPAPTNEESAIDGEQALIRAWEEDGWEGTKAVATYVHFAHENRTEETAAWIVRYEGTCVPFEGPIGDQTEECASDTINVVIDANDGRWLESYSY